jgi:hypothetical protein
MDELDQFLDAPEAPQAIAPDALDAFLDGAEPPQQGTAVTRVIESTPLAAGFIGVGGGLVKAATGAIQAGAQLIGADGVARAAGRQTKAINADLERLGTAGKVGGFVGEVAPYAALPAGAATMAGRAGLGALGGGLSGGLEAQETPDLAKRGQKALTGAAIGAVAIPAVEVAVKGVGAASKGIRMAATGYSARGVEDLAQAAQALKAEASASYKASREAGAVLAKPKAIGIVNNVKTAIQDSGLVNDRLHGDTLSVLKDFQKAAKQGNLGLEALDQYRQLFSDAVKRNMVLGSGPNADAMKSMQAIDAIDDAVSGLGKIDIKGGDINAVKALQNGREQWARFRRFDTIAEVVRQADGDPNRLKSGLQKLVNNRKRMGGFNPEERKALAQAARNSGGELALKTLGKFGFDLGGSLTAGNTALPALGGLVAGGTQGLGVGLALPAAGTAARAMQKLIGRGKVENVLRLIESRPIGADLAREIASEVGNNTKALQAVTAAANMAETPESKSALQALGQSLRQQFADKATDTVADAPITRKPNTVTLQSNPIVPAAILAGGLGAANFASGLAVPNQGPAQDQWVTNRDSLTTQRQAQGMDESADLPRANKSAPSAPQQDMPAIEPAMGPTSAVDPIEQYLDRKMMVESGGRADAKASTSSATGTFQYTTARWLEMAPKAIPELMIGKSKKEILDLRLDPQVSRAVAKYDTLNELAPSLERIGVPITSTTLYLAHFLGETGAKRLLTAKVGTPVEQILDRGQINANQSVLKGKKAEEVLRWAQDKMADVTPKTPKKKRERVRYSEAKKKVGVS